MNNRKVTPITGKHTTLYSMLAEAMADEKAKRGYVIWFEEDGTMHVGRVGTTLSDACMVAIYLDMDATWAMNEDGPDDR